MKNSIKKQLTEAGSRRTELLSKLVSGLVSGLVSRFSRLSLVTSLAIATALFSSSASAALPELATKPLSTANALVKPNLMFVLDTSLSMTGSFASDALTDSGQCKVAMKNTNGQGISAISRSGTTLTITTSGAPPTSGVVYLAIPGNTYFSGIYAITGNNGVAATCSANTSVIINNPYKRDQFNYFAGDPTYDGPRPPYNGCLVTSAAPDNSGSTTQDFNRGGGEVIGATGGTGTADSRCYWWDPLDNAIGTIACYSSTGGSAATSFTVTVADSGTSGAFSPAEIDGARVAVRSESSACLNNEPPLVAAKIQSLFYDPSVSYTPPPWPKLVGLGLSAPANRLPSMTSAYTGGWTAIRIDGTRLVAGTGDPVTTAPNTFNFINSLGGARSELVYCDTPDRPAIYGTDKLWHESSRCKRNSLTSNTVASSPNYPYAYPAQTKGGSLNPSTTSFYSNNILRQNGLTVTTLQNPVADLYAFGEAYQFAAPFYYKVRPIEYCNSARLNNCITSSTPSGAYTTPAYVRYCKWALHATFANLSVGAPWCQGTYTGAFTNNSAPATSDYRFAKYGLFERIDVVPAMPNQPLTGDRINDCGTDYCDYAEEMTNFANWYSYYRTRMQLMKSAAGRTFDTINSDYRVGLITVEGYNTDGNYLPIKDFLTGTNAHKENWFKTLYSRTPSGGTSLRDILGTVGRIYAGKKPVTGFTATDDDPMQYSCQQNFTLLTTDGYWNGPAGLKVDGSAIGNQDAAPVAFPQREGAVAVDTLADVAMYYSKTDIRNATAAGFASCTGALGLDVCDDANADATKATQRMTTFTLGLGVNGSLSYTSDYKTPTGDFIGLSNGSLTWPVPGPDNGDTVYTPAERATIDDLWHAAVNGNGTYFSARNPTQIISGIGDTLVQLGDLTGTASTTDLSNTTPVVGDNYAFSARYTKGSWTGNLFARTVNDRAVLSNNAVWCVEQANYVTPPCSPSATTGLYTKVSPTADSRTIYANNAGSLVPFKYASLPSTQQGYFNSTYLSTRLSQWGSYTPSQITKINTGAVDGVALVDYLRGQTAFDYRDANDLGTPNDNRFFRQRTAVLGDIVESDPKYMGKAEFAYLDTGYSAYAASTVTRAKSVYVGANDGMLHAFNADTGEERWAFVPTAVMQNMWKLADRDYRNLHANFVNAKMTIGDVYISGAWKTILVSGLGEGGRAYFALDITDPLSPTLLWEFDSTTEPNLGFTYGTPIITKKPDGTWVVIVPSGYNNINDGKGRLFILNPANGAKLAELATTAGSAATPSGLAQVSGFYNNVIKNNQAKYVYGGDLLGNVWRFDIETNAVFNLTTLVAGGFPQPITVPPTLSRINGKRVVIIGTGKLIEPSDLLPANYKLQSLYVFQDDDLMATVPDLRAPGIMVEQTLAATSGSRTGSNNPVDFTTKLGWYADFPNSATTGERQNIRSQVVSGLLIVPTMIPATGSCDTTGKGWYNVFNVKTGALINSTQTTEPIAGFFIAIPANAIAVGDPDYPAGAVDPFIVGAEGVGGVSNRNLGDGLGGNGAFVGNRAVWRELIQ